MGVPTGGRAMLSQSHVTCGRAIAHSPRPLPQSSSGLWAIRSIPHACALSKALSILIFNLCLMLSAHAQTSPQVCKTAVPTPSEAQISAYTTLLQNALTEDIHSKITLAKFFLSFDEAKSYAQQAYRGTDMAHDSLKLNSIAQFYEKLSGEAQQAIALYQQQVQSIKLYRYFERPGPVEESPIYVVTMIVTYNDGKTEGLKVNLVPFNSSFKILNIEN